MKKIISFWVFKGVERIVSILFEVLPLTLCWNMRRIMKIHCVPLATEPGISLIILTTMKILNRSTFVAWEMKRNVSVVRLIVATRSSGPPTRGKIIKEMPDSVASGTPNVSLVNTQIDTSDIFLPNRIFSDKAVAEFVVDYLKYFPFIPNFIN